MEKVPTYHIFTTDEFEKAFHKLDHSLQEQVRKKIADLEINPFAGKPLGTAFFRERKVRHLRIYYLIYESVVAVFVIALSDKKTQQETIDAIKNSLPRYQEQLKKSL